MERNPLIVVGSGPGEDVDSETVIDNWKRAVDTGLGCVIIDSHGDSDVAAAAASKAGAYVFFDEDAEDEELLSNYETESGAERVARSVNRFDRFYNHDVIINIYAKLPKLASNTISSLLYPLANLDVEVATLVVPIGREEANSDEIVKASVQPIPRSRVHILGDCQVGQVHQFTRSIDDLAEGEQVYRHIPMYAYKRAALDRFVNYGPTVKEMEDRLEPERALANGMNVQAVIVDPSML